MKFPTFFPLAATPIKANLPAMKKLLATIAFALAGAFTARAGKPVVAGPLAADSWMKSVPTVQILDVRTREEFESGHIDKAIRIAWPDKEFAKRINQKLDPKKPVLVYCRSGRRSAQAAEELVKLGFTDVRNLQGGILLWTESGKPLVKPG